VGLTGCALQDDVRDFLEAGVDLVLSKPLRIDQLESLLTFVKESGFMAADGMKLVQDIGGKLTWVQK